jgi:hypothetical protein
VTGMRARGNLFLFPGAYPTLFSTHMYSGGIKQASSCAAIVHPGVGVRGDRDVLARCKEVKPFEGIGSGVGGNRDHCLLCVCCALTSSELALFSAHSTPEVRIWHASSYGSRE